MTIINSKFNGLPVDFTVQSIIYLNHWKSKTYGKIHHIINEHGKISFENVLDTIRNCNIQIEHVSYDEWREKLMSKSNQNDLFEYVQEFFIHYPFKQTSTLSDEQISPLDNNYIMKWILFILNNVINS
jgi:hypothetical protein